jgi:prepilin-type N-terminal cleavage/methylation domain-containing protein
MVAAPSLKNWSGFTLIELLIVIAIIGILAAVVLVAVNPAQRIQEAYMSQTEEQLATLNTAIETMTLLNGGIYPADVDRGLPNGIEKYLKTGDWPAAPFPESVFDWDNIPSISGYPAYKQVSVRFCPLNDSSHCRFPTFTWSKNFDYYSSVFYCISGPCKSHQDKPADWPGYCVNCEVKERPTSTP